ncbi:hypothetical protein FB45DRAFT_730645, partial [Roridomyces roridus]
MGSQVTDYQCRGEDLSQTSVWEFIRQVDKVRKTSDRRKHKSVNDDSDAEGDVHDDACIDSAFDEDAVEEPIADAECISPLHVESRNRPRVPLLEGHEQCKTHALRVRSPNDVFVPVPIGPGIPCRDRTELRARYCRLMLIFFKPWRHAADLREDYISWESAFEAFEKSCSPAVRVKMENMQLLHECRDSRDDHFAERR